MRIFEKHKINQFNLPLLINDNKNKPVKQEQLVMTVHEICAFDSILQLVTNGIAAHAAYQNEIVICRYFSIGPIHFRK